MRYRYFRNSVTTLGWILSTILVGIILPPILVNKIGLSTYGVWALIGIVNSYVALLDFGLSGGLIKLVAESTVSDDITKVNSYVNILFWFYTLIVLIGLLFFTFYGTLIARLILGSLGNWVVYLPIFRAYGMISLIGLLSIPFSGLIKGLQRYDLVNYVEIFALIINAVFSIILLLLNWGLWALLTGSLIAALFRQITYVIISIKEFRPYKLKWIHSGDFSNFRKMAHLGKAELSVKVSAVISQSVLRLGISYFAGIEFVGIYDLARRVVIQISGLTTVVFSPLVPAISDLGARGANEKINSFLKKTYQYLLMIGLPLTLFIFLFAFPLYQAWLHIDSSFWISYTGRLLSIATLFELLTGPVANTALGLGNPNLHIIAVSTSLVLKIVGVFTLGQFMGYSGIIVGETGAMIFASLLCLFLFQNWYKLSVFKMISGPLLKAGVLSLLIWVPILFVWLEYSASLIWNSLLFWGGIFLIGIGLHIFLYRVFKLITPYEIDLIRSLIPFRVNSSSR